MKRRQSVQNGTVFHGGSGHAESLLECVFPSAKEVMIWFILAILAILWMLGSHVSIAGGLVHLLLISALILMIWKLLFGRRRLW
jgi:uncharacterized protein DUF5670